MYKCPECECNYFSGDIDPEPLCKWCTSADPRDDELTRLRAENKALEEKIDAMGDMNHEIITRYRTALESIKAEVGTSTLAWKLASDALEEKKEEK